MESSFFERVGVSRDRRVCAERDLVERNVAPRIYLMDRIDDSLDGGDRNASATVADVGVIDVVREYADLFVIEPSLCAVKIIPH